ncbi:hypothetical protein LPJ72_003657 [Coemansia sp. Benny D160-2]|nr:hypothetical protein LPJ72_003657 [Coemansia sp. Benny D160-2]
MRPFLLILLVLLVQVVGSPVDPEPVDKRQDIDITVDIPAFVTTIPFTISSGPNIVSGSASIYFKTTRSVKYVGEPGMRFFASISVTTFLFIFDYQSSLLNGAIVSAHKDTLYLCRVSATLRSLQVSNLLIAS